MKLLDNIEELVKDHTKDIDNRRKIPTNKVQNYRIQYDGEDDDDN